MLAVSLAASISAGPVLETEKSAEIDTNGDSSEKYKFVVTENPYEHKYTGHVIFSGHTRSARLHVAPGAYPVYYALARANGKFLGKSIRTLSPNEIKTYTNRL